MDRGCGKHSKQNSRKTLLFAATILSSCFLLSQGQAGTIPLTVEPPMPRKGGSVTLKAGTLPENSISCRWYRGVAADENLIRIHYLVVPGDPTGPAYTGRETVDSSCSLHITDLNTTDSGTYTLTTDGPGLVATGTAKFEIIDDAGTYTCAASNHLSTEESNPSIITLAYGPLNVKVEPAGFINQKVGSKLVLLCTADSNPEAQFQWFFNGTDQRMMNNTFSVDSVAWKDEGNYICQASNTITKFHGLASLFVKVTKQDSSGSGSGGLSGGAIAGIVLGSLAVMLALTGTLFCFFFRRNTLEPKNLQGGRHQGGTTEPPVIPPPSYYENIGPSGLTGANLESSLGTSHTYVELQYKNQAVYQEIK